VPSHQDFEQRRLAGEDARHDLLIREQGPPFQNWRAHNLHRLSVAGLPE
jgi:hypothetical protein